tara:strand:+ start:878 stop:1453 length:576 start_codon:yes stop_codon:yes gene_type:complete
MKYILLLLLPINLYAVTLLEIINKDGQALSKKFETEEQADAYVIANKHNWGIDAGWYRERCDNYISTRGAMDELDVPVIEYNCPATYSISKSDITQQELFKKIKGLASQNIACGESVKAFVGAINITKGLTNTQISQMIQTYSTVNELLSGGALDTAIETLQAMSADGVLVTETDKALIVAEINKCKAVWE